MHPHSPTYQRAFRRYLRHGISLDLQLKTAREESEEMFRTRLSTVSRRAEEIVDSRLQALEVFFARNDLDFPDTPPPELGALERAFEKAYRTMLKRYMDAAGTMLPEETREGVERSERFLAGRFRQQVDAVLQPHYGVEYFTWVGGGGENSCDNCAAHSGQTFSWKEDAGPPGCEHCLCNAEPAIKPPNDPPIEPVYPELAAVAALRAAQALIRLWERINKPKPEEKPKPQEQPKPEATKPKPSNDKLTERPKNVPKDWKEVPANKGQGTKYVDPKNQHNDVRVQQGNPNNSNPGQQQDYVKWKKDGQWLDKDANIVEGTSPEAHIPLDEFEFNPEIYK